MFVDASDGMRLEQTWHGKCLTHDTSVSSGQPAGRHCDPANPYQEWRWLNYLFLQNVGSGQCLQTFSDWPVYRMQECSFSSEQRCACRFNSIKPSTPTKMMCLNSDSNVVQMNQELHERECKWKVFGASNEESICNTTTGMVILFEKWT
jgi:hypothetical protein